MPSSAMIDTGFRVSVYMSDDVWGEKLLADQPWAFSQKVFVYGAFIATDPVPWGDLERVTTMLEPVLD